MSQVTPVEVLVNDAQRRVLGLNVARAQLALRSGAVLVDIRESEERFREGVVPGALHVPRGMLEFCADPASPFHRPELARAPALVLLCGWGSRSALAALTLRRMGVRPVAHLHGGFEAWRAAGAPVAPGGQGRRASRRSPWRRFWRALAGPAGVSAG